MIRSTLLTLSLFCLSTAANAANCKKGGIYSVLKATGLNYSNYQEFSLEKNTVVRYLGRDHGGNIILRTFDVSKPTQDCELIIKDEKVTQVCTSQLSERNETLTLMYSRTKLKECTL